MLALYGYRWLFIVDAATCWVAAVFLTRISVEEVSKPRGKGRQEPPGRAPWQDGPFLCLLLLVIALASVLFQIFSTLPLYFREEVGLRENAIGLLISLNAFLIVAFEMVLIHAVRNRDRYRLAGLGALFLCAGYALIPYRSEIGYMAFTVAVWTFGEMLALPMLNVIVAERAGKGYQGQYMGLYSMAYSIAFIVAPAAGTYVYDRVGPAMLWHGIGGLGVVLYLSFFALRKSYEKLERKRGNETDSSPQSSNTNVGSS
jgi:predicted MFS family arabinose efflux permease